MQPRFFMAEALRSIRSNLALAGAATVTVLIAVFVMGAFISAFLYVQSAVDSQKEKIDVSFWISDAATVDQVNGLLFAESGFHQFKPQVHGQVRIHDDRAVVGID